MDLLGWSLVAPLLLLLLGAKTWAVEGLPWLALRSSSHAATALGLALLAAHRREVYVSYRELLVTAALFNLTWVVRSLGERLAAWIAAC